MTASTGACSTSTGRRPAGGSGVGGDRGGRRVSDRRAAAVSGGGHRLVRRRAAPGPPAARRPTRSLGWRHSIRRLKRTLVRAAVGRRQPRRRAAAGHAASGVRPAPLATGCRRRAAGRRRRAGRGDALDALDVAPPRSPRTRPLPKSAARRPSAALRGRDRRRRDGTAARLARGRRGSDSPGKPVLYVPLSRGGRPDRIVRARCRERLLERLAASLPAAGPGRGDDRGSCSWPRPSRAGGRRGRRVSASLTGSLRRPRRPWSSGSWRAPARPDAGGADPTRLVGDRADSRGAGAARAAAARNLDDPCPAAAALGARAGAGRQEPSTPRGSSSSGMARACLPSICSRPRRCGGSSAGGCGSISSGCSSGERASRSRRASTAARGRSGCLTDLAVGHAADPAGGLLGCGSCSRASRKTMPSIATGTPPRPSRIGAKCSTFCSTTCGSRPNTIGSPGRCGR